MRVECNVLFALQWGGEYIFFEDKISLPMAPAVGMCIVFEDQRDMEITKVVLHENKIVLEGHEDWTRQTHEQFTDAACAHAASGWWRTK